MINKYVKFSFVRDSKTGLTKIWDIKSNENILLGKVKWFGQWRKYVFFPEDDTIFDNLCLNEIKIFIEEETENHKKTRNFG